MENENNTIRAWSEPELEVNDDDMYKKHFTMFRHPYHDICLTYDGEKNLWYGVVRLSSVQDGTCGEFINDKDLPDDIVAKLVNELNLEDKISHSRGFSK